MTASRMALCVIALALTLLGTWMLNRFIFPVYDMYLMPLRDIDSMVTGAVFIAIACIAARSALPFASKWFMPVVIASSIAAAALLALGVVLGSAPLVIIASILFSISGGMASVMLPIMFLDASLGEAGVAVALATAIALVLRYPLQALPLFAGCAASMAVRIAMVLIVYAGVRSWSPRPADPRSMQDAHLSKPSSFIPFSSQVFVCLFIFQMMFGVALTYNEVGRVPVGTGSELLFVLPAAAYICVLAKRGKEFDSDFVFRFAYMFIVAGFLVISVSTMLPDATANLLIYAGSDLFGIVAWYVFIAIGSRNELGAIATFSWSTAVKYFGVVAGANLGRLLNGGNVLGVPREVFVAVLILGFMGYFTYFLSHERFGEIIHRVTPVEEVLPPAGALANPSPETQPDAEAGVESSAFRESCLKIAASYDLTAREGDVLELLARGRNGHFIQESLVVSYNTVKTHVLHIYTKLGIHSQQELIDMVEKEMS